MTPTRLRSRVTNIPGRRALGALLLACTLSSIAGAQGTVAPRGVYVPHRVYDAREKRWTDFEYLVQKANAAEVVFVGEQHDNGPGHAMELALLEGLARRRAGSGKGVVLSLEMFERDVQSGLDAYLAGARTESEFLGSSRPWPNYQLDYRPLVEVARASRWPVIAANVPRRIAAMVSRGSLAAIDTLGAESRQWVARSLECPRDDYYERFAKSAGSHGGPSGAAPPDSAARAMTDRFYEAQCVKDETMAEAIAMALDSARARGSDALVVHMNGAFHSDFAQGTAERVKRRQKDARRLVISIVPSTDLDAIDAKAMRKQADFLVFTLVRGKP